MAALRPSPHALTGLLEQGQDWLIAAARHRAEPGRRPDGEPLRFLFTIDTEISLGGALDDPALSPVGADRRIWGETEEGRLGIELFMDVFEEFGMRGVFFFETEARHLVDPEGLAAAARCITERGHDVELHVHPEFKMSLAGCRSGAERPPVPQLHAFDLETQRAYLREAADVLEAWTGRRPIAFRAGGYASDEVGTDACAQEGLSFDSSYNAWAIRHGYARFNPAPALNDIAVLPNGVVEVPVTNLAVRGPRSGLRPFELSALGAVEMIPSALEQLYAAGVRVCCSVTHSFRLIRTTSLQYAGARLDSVNLHRLRTLCRYLAAHPDRYQVSTFRDLPLERYRRELGARPPPFFPVPPTWSSVARLAVQAVKDRGGV